MYELIHPTRAFKTDNIEDIFKIFRRYMPVGISNVEVKALVDNGETVSFQGLGDVKLTK